MTLARPLLRGAGQEAGAGSGQAVLHIVEAGIGKSRARLHRRDQIGDGPHILLQSGEAVLVRVA